MKDLVSRRLHLRPLTFDDAAFVYTLYTNKQVYASYETPPIAKEEETIEFIQRITQPGCFVWLMTLLSDRKATGICALHHWDRQAKAIEIGGTLLPPVWGQGLMAEAFQLLLNFANESLGVETILARTQNSNQQAIRMAAKLGFRELNKNGAETTLVYSAILS